MKFKFIFRNMKEMNRFLTFTDNCMGRVTANLEGEPVEADAHSTINFMRLGLNKPIIVTVEDEQDEIKFLKAYQDIREIR